MYQFTSSGEFMVVGRGKIFAIAGGQLPEDVWSPAQLKGHEVIIDDDIYKIAGVEMYGGLCSPEHPYTKNFGFIVG